MSAQLNSYWEPIDAGSDFPRAYAGIDDEDDMDKNGRREIIADPKLQYSLMNAFIMVFMLASGIFFAIMSFAFLEVQTTVETLQLPQEHQVFSDLRHIKNVVTVAFVAIFLGFAVLVNWSGRYLSRKGADARPEFSARKV